MNYRTHQTLASGTPSANAPGATKKTARSLVVFAMTGLVLCAGASLSACSTFPPASTLASAPMQNTKQIAPGLTVVFPAPPKRFAMPVIDKKDFWSAASSIDGHPVRFIAGRVTFPDHGEMKQVKQLLHTAPDVFATMAPLLDGFVSGVDPKAQAKNLVSITEAQRSRATAGFPGIYYAWQNSPLPQDLSGSSDSSDSSNAQDSSDSPDAQDASRLAALPQFHGYMLFVNGDIVMFGLAQPAGTPPDSRALERFIAAAHFPPAEKAGTLQEQLKSAGLAVGKFIHSVDSRDTADTDDDDKKASSDQDDSGDQGDQNNQSDQSDPDPE